MATMSEIETLAKSFAEARTALGERYRALDAELETVKRRNLPALKRAAERAANAELRLAAALEESKSLFEKPRSVIVHGIRVGWVKGKGRIVVDDAGRVAGLIRKHMGERFDELVKTVETPVKSALERLSAAELKRIGVEVVEARDQVVIKPADGEVDKLIEALLDGFRQNAEAGLELAS